METAVFAPVRHPSRPPYCRAVRDRRAETRRGRWMPTRSSRRASICGSARKPTASAPASCPARQPRRRQARAAEAARDRPDAGAVLETGCVYIVPLLETLALPADVAASANPKSSTGRLDIFTRVMTDRGQEFDKIAGRLSRAALSRGQPAHLPDRGADRLAPVADPLPHRQCAC
jgi:hypothetical protein